MCIYNIIINMQHKPHVWHLPVTALLRSPQPSPPMKNIASLQFLQEVSARDAEQT